MTEPSKYDWENVKTMPRFLKFISPEPNTGCWLWSGCLDVNGYGRFSVGSMKDGTRATRFAHRVAYELFVGEISRGLALDHLCRVPGCVNPYHLEPVTDRVNILRGKGPAAENAKKGHCEHGHAFTPENTVFSTQRGRQRRHCRRCRILSDRRRRSPHH